MILGAAFRLFRNLNSNQEDTVAVLVGRNPAIVSGRRCSGLVSQDTATVYVPVTGRHILLLGEPNLFIYVDISTYAHPISNTMHLCHHACKKPPSMLSLIYFVAVPCLCCSRIFLPVSLLPLSPLYHICSAALIRHRLFLLSFYSIPTILHICHRWCHHPPAYLIKSSSHHFPSSLCSSPKIYLPRSFVSAVPLTLLFSTLYTARSD